MDPFDPSKYWDTRLRRNFGLEGVGYARLGRRYNEWMYRVRARVFRRVAGPLPLRSPDTRVLDIGPGTGFYIEQWRRLGAGRITGADIAPVAVEELTRRFPDARFVQADIGAPLSAALGGPYDAVSAFDVLFHVVDDARFARALLNVAALLEPGGWFIFSDNFLHDRTIRVRHQVSRSLAEITAGLEAAGFEIVVRRPMFILMNHPGDTPSRWPEWAWKALVAPATVSEAAGFLIGAALYPLELGLTAVCRESPTTEIMVCRKRT